MLSQIVINRVHLGMEFQTDYTVTDVNEAGAAIFFNNLLAFFETRQKDDAGIFVHLHIALLLKIIVILSVWLWLCRKIHNLSSAFLRSSWELSISASS